MNSFKNEKLRQARIPMNIVKLIEKINEYKGKQDLYIKQSPQILEKLKEVAIVQSTKASNSIEGIVITDQRLKVIMNDNTNLKDRSEGEIAGYKDILNTIHTSYDGIPINFNIILQLHLDLYKYISTQGGVWKNHDNIISEELPNGETLIRFKPVSAYATKEAMEELCELLNDSISTDEIEPLILTGTFILDFLCIHPFNDGNDRMSRLLTLLLLYKYDYLVGRYISLEKVIEESKSSYYKTLRKSSNNWHEGNYYIFAWLEYFLGTILAAYREFEDRVGHIENIKGNKEFQIEKAIKNVLGIFSKDDIRKSCPDISESTINRVFNKLKEDGTIEVLGKGRTAKWRRLR
ncbi:MAG: Fic family protein [Clostridiales bacterium]|nr:Fic family protein [Clostridiales bacterium]